MLKRIGPLLLLLLLLPGLALAEGRAMVLPLQDGAVLVSADGQALTVRGAYSHIESISSEDVSPKDELFVATPSYDETSSGLSLLMDANGQALTDPVYSWLRDEGGVIRYVQDGLQGVMGRDLTPIVSCSYTVLVANGEGSYLGLTSDPYDDKPDGVYHIDMAGNETATNVRILGPMGAFTEGLCTATSAETGRVGYLSAVGEWAIQPQLEYGGEFKNGRAEACIESGYGVIDTSGNWLMTPKYALVSTGFGDGNMILASQDNSAVYLIDPRNYQVKVTFEDDEIYFGAYFDRDYVVLYRSDSVELIDEGGNVLMQTTADGNFDVWYEMGDRVIARRGSWGERNTYLVDLSGADVAGPYREISLMGVGEDGAPYFAFSDQGGGEEQSEAEGEIEIESYGDGAAIDAGLMDRDGSVVIPAGRFLYMEQAAPGYLIAATADERGIIRMNGEWLVKYPNHA